LLTFQSSPITISDIAIAETEASTVDQVSSEGNQKIWDDGTAIIYVPRPLELVPEGKLLSLDKMIVKISDFGLG
jgi:hypothetical protein